MKTRALFAYSFLVVLGTVLTQVQPPLKPRGVARGGNSPAARSSSQARPGETLPAAARAQLVASYGKLPLSFEANQGQTDGVVKFLSRGHGYTLFLTSREAVLELRIADFGLRNEKTPHSAFRTPHSAVLRMELVGANRVSRSSGLEELPGKANYFIGNDPSKWRRNVSTYAKVRYEDVYPGIGLVYYGNQRQLEYDFVVAPGADPGRIRLRFDGAQKIDLDAEGNLVVETPAGQVVQHKPSVYQPVGGVNQAIGGGYVLKGKNEVGFKVAAYDPRRPLVLDPTLVYSTYLGGSGTDDARAIAVDSAGNAYLTGSTKSVDFPTTGPGPLQGNLRGDSDTFVTKLNAAGTALVYSTYLGGELDDTAFGIAVDSAGNAYITGATTSTNFPTLNALQRRAGALDAFVAKINAAGSALVYSTYLGGTFDDQGAGIAVDSAGNAYVAGTTTSSNFPTANPIQVTNRGGSDAFVAKLNPAGSALVYSTYLGGSTTDRARGIAVDTVGNAYITGETQSSNFRTANPLQGLFGGGLKDAFVAKLATSGGVLTLVYSTYLGGSSDEEGLAIAVDSAGNAYITGATGSRNFPTLNALQRSSGGASDAFVAKINAAGSALVYSTYLGGSSFDEGRGIAVDSAGNAYVAGSTVSSNFPTADPIPPILVGGGEDAFVAKLNPAGSALVYSTHLSGLAADFARAIAVDSAGNAYVAGSTSSLDFPTAKPIQVTGGGQDAFVAKLSADAGSTGCTYSISPTSRSHGSGVETGTVSVTAATGCTWTATSNAPWITITSGASGSGNGTVNYSVAANPVPVPRTGTMTISGQNFTATFTVTQTTLPSCSFTISPTSASHGSGAESGTVAVTAATGCNWTAASSAPWITISSGSGGSGDGTVSYSVAANPDVNSRTGTLTIAGLTFTITQAGTGGEGPVFYSFSITNGASFMPGLTAGSIVSIFGERLSNVTGIVAASGFPLPTQLRGTSVTIGGTPAPLFVVANVEGTEQINLQVPWEIQGRTTTRVVVNNNGLTAGVDVDVPPAHPGVFLAQEGFGAILHGEDYSLVTLAKPARRGEVVVIYATGLGPVEPTTRTGIPAPVDPLSRTRTPRVTVSGVPAEVAFSGLAVGFVGLYQVNIVVPGNAPSGPALVLIEVGERSSNPVLIALQ